MNAEVAQRAPMGFGTSFVQQMKLLGWSRRWALMAFALLFMLALAGTVDTDFGLPRIHLAAIMGLPIAACWPLAVWYGEVPHRRSYHWSLPVSRPAHDLARIAAGAVWLAAVYLAFAGAGAIVAMATGDEARFAASGSAWITFFAGPLVLYLFVMPLLLWSDSPGMRRGLAAFCILSLVATVLELQAYMDLMETIFGNGRGFASVLLGGFQEQAEVEIDPPGPRVAAALWLAICLAVTLFTATFRTSDLARLLRRQTRKV